MEWVEWLRVFIQSNQSIEYLVIFMGVVFGGEIALFTLGFLAAQGVVSTLPVVIISFIGSFFPNTLWFLLGRTNTAERITSHRYTNRTVRSITDAVRRASRGSHLVALIIIKFLVGTPVMLTMYINKTNLPFRKFILYQAVAIALSLLVIIPIGYLAGLGFTYFSRILKNLYAGLGFLLLFIIGVIMALSWFEKRFTKDITNNSENKL